MAGVFDISTSGNKFQQTAERQSVAVGKMVGVLRGMFRLYSSSHRIHVLYIYLHKWLIIFMVNVGKYTLHGSFGVPFNWIRLQGRYTKKVRCMQKNKWTIDTTKDSGFPQDS